VVYMRDTLIPIKHDLTKSTRYYAMLGNAKDNRAVLLKAVAYLDKHKGPSFSDKFYRPSKWGQATA